MSTIVYIGLGSNLGDRTATCRRALELLARSCRVTKVSSFYCTEPVGFEGQEDFVNAVAEVETDLEPDALLTLCQKIEDELGRTRTVRWGPRTIDLDILLFGERIIDKTNLVVPHPLIALRRFVLAPLCEIAPQTRHPVLDKTAAELLRELRDEHRVSKCGAA